jgi:hypothetical protein
VLFFHQLYGSVEYDTVHVWQVHFCYHAAQLLYVNGESNIVLIPIVVAVSSDQACLLNICTIIMFTIESQNMLL